MTVLLLEPYYTGSHARWAEGLRTYSRHRIEILSLPGSFWKWRMHGGAVSLAKKFLASDIRPDLILATDMLDLSAFLALTRHRTAGIPAAVYFHENQLTYPWSPRDRDVARQRDHHYGFINYLSAMAADAVYFNSAYHRDIFLTSLPRFLKAFPDHREPASVEEIAEKSAVLHLGLDLNRFDACRAAGTPGPPVILWNHRWEHDKNPAGFFAALDILVQRNVAFRLMLLGENFMEQPREFEEARTRYGERVIHYGFAERFEDYAALLWQADILPVTSEHDFFGTSVVEAVYCGCLPLLPRRLAYPETVPSDRFGTCFYETPGQLTELLIRACTAEIPLPAGLRPAMERFDWKYAAPVYDRTFDRLRVSGA